MTNRDRRYRQSAKGKAAERRREASERRKAWRRAYYARKKAARDAPGCPTIDDLGAVKG